MTSRRCESCRRQVPVRRCAVEVDMPGGYIRNKTGWLCGGCAAAALDILGGPQSQRYLQYDDGQVGVVVGVSFELTDEDLGTMA